jgi:hypothetical protein
VLSTAAPCVTGLLSDEQAQLAREAAQAAHVLLTRGLSMLAAAPQVCAAAGCNLLEAAAVSQAAVLVPKRTGERPCAFSRHIVGQHCSSSCNRVAAAAGLP